MTRMSLLQEDKRLVKPRTRRLTRRYNTTKLLQRRLDCTDV